MCCSASSGASRITFSVVALRLLFHFLLVVLLAVGCSFGASSFSSGSYSLSEPNSSRRLARSSKSLLSNGSPKPPSDPGRSALELFLLLSVAFIFFQFPNAKGLNHDFVCGSSAVAYD